MHFFSDFPHLLKNLRNAFVTKGFNTPQGYANVSFIREAWKNDGQSVSLKVMPRIPNAPISPNSFEKMRVGLAFQLFGDKVIKGIFLYLNKIEKACGPVAPTQCFITKIKRLIRVMAFRAPKKALYQNSPNCQFMKDFFCVT